jgi:hypothetical protein
MQISAITLALAAASQAVAVAIPASQHLAARQISCAEVTRKLEACTDACNSSDWRCTVNWYVHPLLCLSLTGTKI